MTTARKALAAYERNLVRRNLAPVTCARLLWTARRFLGHTKVPLRRLGLRDLSTYLAGRSLVLSPATLVAETSRLRGFFRALVVEGLLDASPADGLDVKPVARVGRRVLSERAVREILAAASATGGPVALRDRALLELLYGLGLRASEVQALGVVDLDPVEGTVVVQPAKRGVPRVLPLPRASLSHLVDYLRAGRPALLGGRGRDNGRLLLNRRGSPLYENQVAVIVSEVAARAGLQAKPHDFRHAVASHLNRRGVSVLAIQDLLGHNTVRSTQVYLSLEREDLRRAVETLEKNLAGIPLHRP